MTVIPFFPTGENLRALQPHNLRTHLNLTINTPKYTRYSQKNGYFFYPDREGSKLQNSYKFQLAARIMQE